MDQNWQSNADLSGTQQARYSQNAAQQHTRNYSSSGQQQPPAGFTYDNTYQTPTIPSHPQSSAASPASTPHLKQEYIGDGDVAMEDADPYNRMKYPSRPNHSHRVSSQYLSQEDSAAAKRYSPMKTLSPSSPYAASPQQPNHSAYSAYAPQSASARQSPTRTNTHGSSSSQSYYQSPGKFYESNGRCCSGCLTSRLGVVSSRHHPLHLSPIHPGETPNSEYYPNSATVQLNAMFGREVKSPRHPYPPSHGPNSARGPIPRFTKLKTVQEIEPRINLQPAFRRANPEGGFISVSSSWLLLFLQGLICDSRSKH